VWALIFPGGPPDTVYRLALEGEIELVSSAPLLAELARVLAEKFGWRPERAEELTEQLIRIAEIADPQDAVTEIEAGPTDDRARSRSGRRGRRDRLGRSAPPRARRLARNHDPVTTAFLEGFEEIGKSP
jgi:hypothetical protein